MINGLTQNHFLMINKEYKIKNLIGGKDMKMTKCPICGYKKFKDEHYAEEGYGIVEQHCYCDRCGYMIGQCYSEPIDGFYPPIKRGSKDYKGIYHPKNWRKRKRMKRKYNIKYGNKNWMLIFI